MLPESYSYPDSLFCPLIMNLVRLCGLQCNTLQLGLGKWQVLCAVGMSSSFQPAALLDKELEGP